MNLPEKPWGEGATFTNDETGVKYTFDGEKWLAGGGAEADDATLALINEVDRTSQMRDESLDAKIEQESNLNTVAHIKFEDQILRCYAWSEGDNESLERKLTKVDEELQAQIDVNKVESEDGDRQLQAEVDQIALALEALLVQREHGQWKYVGFSGDNIPRNAGEFALASDDLSSSDNIITINQEDLEGTTHGFSDVEVGDYLEIVDLDEPANYALFTVTKAPEGSGIVNVEVSLKDKGQNILIGETCEIRFFQVNEQDLQLDDLDARYLRLAGGSMDGSATLKVNVLEPVNTPMIQYNGDPDSTHAAGLINRYMMTEHTKQYLKLSGGNLTGGINMGTNPIMSVQYLGMTGAKCIQEAQTTRIKFEGKVVIPRVGDNKDGFVIKGQNNSDLLSAYHHSTDPDSINYTGKTGGSTNIATCGYVDSRIGASKGALASHMERLYHKGNQTDGKSFYFNNQNGVPTTGMNDFRKFKWKLPSSHYLNNMVGAGRDMGYIVISSTSGQLLYQCQVSNAQKDDLYITLELDHDNHYGTSILGDAGWYIVQLFSCLREGQ